MRRAMTCLASLVRRDFIDILTHRSLSLLRPTIRVKGSQLWANWNPRRKSDAIDDFLRAKKPDNANWRDNPWFPDVLDEERDADCRDGCRSKKRCGTLERASCDSEMIMLGL